MAQSNGNDARDKGDASRNADEGSRRQDTAKSPDKGRGGKVSTDERMRKAIPMPLPNVDPNSVRRQSGK